MKISPIVAELKAHCPLFEGRVAGAAEFRPLPENARLDLPSAYVVGEPDQPGQPNLSGGYRQDVTDGFSIIVVLDNSGDVRGQAAWDQGEDVRLSLIRALVGWQVDDAYGPIAYDGGGEILHMDRARVYIAYGFRADMALDNSDTRQGLDLDGLSPFTGVTVKVDVLDTAYDPNNIDDGRPTYNPDQPNPRTTGPDGRIEIGADIALDQE
ncbi:MAG: hypothetical protein OQL08_08875 [Gammaproteobacteria bacterium]|nr:hypothetical protein [Gammaproteobacteria bacterium]